MKKASKLAVKKGVKKLKKQDLKKLRGGRLMAEEATLDAMAEEVFSGQTNRQGIKAVDAAD